MRSRFLVTYDVRDEKRLRKVFRCLNGYGDPVQYSVFFCDLSAKERVLLVADLTEQINQDEDQVLIVNLGPTEGRASKSVESLGRSLASPERGAVVV